MTAFASGTRRLWPFPAVFAWTTLVIMAWVLARWFGAGEGVRTILEGLVILNVPLIGMFAIVKGRLRYAVTESPVLNALFWCGWAVGLLVGVATVVQGLIAL